MIVVEVLYKHMSIIVKLILTKIKMMTGIFDMLINLRLFIACNYIPLMFFVTIFNFFSCFAKKIIYVDEQLSQLILYTA